MTATPDREQRIRALVRSRVDPVMAQLRQALPTGAASGIIVYIPNPDLRLPEEEQAPPGQDLLMVVTSSRRAVRAACQAWLAAGQEPADPPPAPLGRVQTVTELPPPDAVAISRAIRKALLEPPGDTPGAEDLIRRVLTTLAQGYAL